MSDNIYNILANFNKVAITPVEPIKTTLTESVKPQRTSMVESLESKYKSFKERLDESYEAYDPGADEDDEYGPDIHNGDYVTDKWESSGEVYRVSQCDGDRCWIGDRDNRGWYIDTSRLNLVNPVTDEYKISQYFDLDADDELEETFESQDDLFEPEEDYRRRTQRDSAFDREFDDEDNFDDDELDEEVELDELSKKTLGSYVNKAHDQLMKHTAASNFKSGRGDADAFAYSRDEKTMRKEKNRKKGLSQAVGKLTKEEVELDELSKKTLGSYVNKASDSMYKMGSDSERAYGQKEIKKSFDIGNKADKRQGHINKAVGKLTKEASEHSPMLWDPEQGFDDNGATGYVREIDTDVIDIPDHLAQALGLNSNTIICDLEYEGTGNGIQFNKVTAQAWDESTDTLGEPVDVSEPASSNKELHDILWSWVSDNDLDNYEKEAAKHQSSDDEWADYNIDESHYSSGMTKQEQHSEVKALLASRAKRHEGMHNESEITEKAVSKSQQKFMGMVHAAQKGEKPASKEVAKVAKGMGKRDVTDFASTKHKGLPKHVTESRLMESENTFDHILHHYSAEVKKFKKEHDLDERLYDALYDYYSEDMPYGIKKARDGDPYAWVSDRFDEDLGLDTVPDMNVELDEIAQLAGLSRNSANKISQPDQHASLDELFPTVDDDDDEYFDPNNPTHFDDDNEDFSESELLPTVDDEDDEDDGDCSMCYGTGEGSYDGSSCRGCGGSGIAGHDSDDEEYDPDGFEDYDPYDDMFEEEIADEGNEFSGALKAAKESGKKEFEVSGKKYTVKEDVTLNVSATGEEDVLNVIRKLSGMPEVTKPSHNEPEEFIDIDEERDIEHVNTPREKIAPVSAAYPSGTDMHRSKKSYSGKPYRGDNPMAESKEDSLWTKYSTMLKGLIK